MKRERDPRLDDIKVAKRLARDWKHGRAGAHSSRGYSRKKKHKRQGSETEKPPRGFPSGASCFWGRATPACTRG